MADVAAVGHIDLRAELIGLHLIVGDREEADRQPDREGVAAVVTLLNSLLSNSIC